jgi:hypothetical protein
MFPHIFASPMRGKETPFVSCLDYILIFAKISLSLISLAGQEDNLRAAASENISHAISPNLDFPYIGKEVKPFFGLFGSPLKVKKLVEKLVKISDRGNRGNS